MISPEPEFYVIFAVPLNVDAGFRVEAVLKKESDAKLYADLLRKSRNYHYVGNPQKEMMGSVLDRLLQQKIGCLAATGAKEITLKIGQ